MTQKEFIPYEQALALKELGFNESCFCAYGAWGLMSSNDVNSLSDVVTQEDLDNQGYNEKDGVCLAPLYSQAFRWFREKYDLDSTIALVANGYGFYVHEDGNYTNNGESYGFYITKEEAELECLKKLIELVKKK